jgi:hypothetical protein
VLEIQLRNGFDDYPRALRRYDPIRTLPHLRACGSCEWILAASYLENSSSLLEEIVARLPERSDGGIYLGKLSGARHLA